MYPWSGDSAFDEVMTIINPHCDIKPSIDQYELARDRLILWQVKSPTFSHLPELEATLSLITAVLKDRNIFDEGGEMTGRLTHKYYDICTFYGMSIVKFCNLLPYYEKTKKKSIQRVIKASKKTVGDLGAALNIPLWVLECRHATCHATTNSLILLRQANDFCLTWIYDNYWSKLVNDMTKSPEADSSAAFERLLDRSVQKFTNSKFFGKVSNLVLEKPEERIPMLVDALIRDSCSHLPKNDIDLGELPNERFRCIARMLQLITSIDFLQIFIHHLTNYFVDTDPSKARVSILWFKVTTRCLANQSEDDLIAGLSLTECDSEISSIVWQRILYQAIRRLTKYTPEIVDHLSNLIPSESVPGEAMELLKKLSLRATTVNNMKSKDSEKSEKSQESVKTSPFTIFDLLKQIKPSEPMNTS